MEKNIKFKQNYLTASQISSLVYEVLEIYNNGGLMDGYAFNPVNMEMNFYAGLFYYLIDGFEMDNEEMFDELFALGVHNRILEEVENAKLAHTLMWKSAKSMSNSLGKILAKVNEFIEKLPEAENYSELLDKLPEEWNKVKDEYKQIINNNTEMGDEN